MTQSADTTWDTSLMPCGHGSPPHEAVDNFVLAHSSAPPVEHISSKTNASTSLVQTVECQPPYAVADTETTSNHPLSSFPFFGKFGDKKMTRDGQPPKRRGPKPDSKPALTRRQELNRQAQRTHRERKEMYIKALEQEVLRLKDFFAAKAQDRDALAEENRRLKELLAAHGISYDANSPSGGFRMGGTSSYDGSSRGSVSGSYNTGSASTGYTSPPPSMPQRGAANMSMAGMAPSHPGVLPQNNGMNYDQIGIDFVLTLEKPCMDHMQFLLVRSQDSEAEVSGHALMATCPPHSHIANAPKEQYPHKMPDVGTGDLMKLLDLSNRLPVMEGEVTPVMAWAMILSHPRLAELTMDDLAIMKEDLLAKVRCYGFGAVIEEFEVRDALSSVLAGKGQQPVSYSSASSA
ncbi:hypothetical protein JOL62DRAFT_567415 [Phyllosticta paracitricarpa]|uniref:BZIP domain-containing protein n=1 Tax=Phyllosticta paracitricarpa TaxID=2016321 RepID=A0ABR1NGC6_9PEZI